VTKVNGNGTNKFKLVDKIRIFGESSREIRADTGVLFLIPETNPNIQAIANSTKMVWVVDECDLLAFLIERQEKPEQ
jgi:hypothetical protein